MGHAVVGRKECRIVLLANFFIQILEELAQFAVEPEKPVFGFNGIGTKGMPDVIGRRKTDCQEIGVLIETQTFPFDGRPGKFEGQGVSGRHCRNLSIVPADEFFCVVWKNGAERF